MTKDLDNALDAASRAKGKPDPSQPVDMVMQNMNSVTTPKQIYSSFGVPVRIVEKYQLPTRCYLVKLAMMATGEKDGQGRLIVPLESDGVILHATDKKAKGWNHDGVLRCGEGWPDLKPQLEAAPETKTLTEKEALAICKYLGFLYSMEEANV